MMYLKQLYTECLAEAAYYIESNNEAAIIDPLRETSPYIELAQKRNAKIKYIFLTHFHADFVSGHVDLAEKTGAIIVFGPNANPQFNFHSGKDNEVFKLGDVSLKLLHTPGHTMESSTYLLLDEHNKEKAIFTGDTLFIGDVGRPDLAVKSTLTEADLAAHLYSSLRTKIMPLPNDVVVYPAHGAGSACGKNMSKETFDTLGHQKEVNYALRANMTKEDFVKEVTTGLLPPPQYFPKNVMMNKEINKSFDAILKQGTTPLSPKEIAQLTNDKNILLLDVRSTTEFIKEHLPNSIFIGLDGAFAPWVGTLIEDLNQPIIVIAPKGREEEVVTRLSRVGYDNTLGYLSGGIEEWKAAGYETEAINSITSNQFSEVFTPNINIVDVRKKSEFFTEHIEHNHLINIPLDTISTHFNTIDKNNTHYVHCAGGYRSLIAISILKRNGYNKLINIEGGFAALKTIETIKCSAYACPSTMPV